MGVRAKSEVWRRPDSVRVNKQRLYRRKATLKMVLSRCGLDGDGKEIVRLCMCSQWLFK